MKRPGSWVYRAKWEEYHGKKIPAGHHIHHIDGNPWNNAKENLLCCTPMEHYKIHKEQGDHWEAQMILGTFTNLWLDETNFNNHGIPRLRSCYSDLIKVPDRAKRLYKDSPLKELPEIHQPELMEDLSVFDIEYNESDDFNLYDFMLDVFDEFLDRKLNGKRNLKGVERAVMKRIVLDNERYSAVAKDLNKSTSTLMVVKNRALKKLKENSVNIKTKLHGNNY